MEWPKQPAWRLTKQFIAALAFLATFFGFYIATFFPDHKNLLIFIPHASAIWALLWVYGGPLFRAAKQAQARIRDYDRIEREGLRALAAAGRKTAEVEHLKRELSNRIDEVKSIENRGTLEGRRRAVGEILASTSKAQLRPVAMGIQENSLVISALHEEGLPPPVGSRFMLGAPPFKATAVLSVTEYEPNEKGVLLGVARTLDEEVVEGLLSAVKAGNSDPPGSLRIYPRTAVSPSTYISEVGD